MPSKVVSPTSPTNVFKAGLWHDMMYNDDSPKKTKTMARNQSFSQNQSFRTLGIRNQSCKTMGTRNQSFMNLNKKAATVTATSNHAARPSTTLHRTPSQCRLSRTSSLRSGGPVTFTTERMSRSISGRLSQKLGRSSMSNRDVSYGNVSDGPLAKKWGIEKVVVFDDKKSPEEWQKLLTPAEFICLVQRKMEPVEVVRKSHMEKVPIGDNQDLLFVCSACGTPVFHQHSRKESNDGRLTFAECLPGTTGCVPNLVDFRARVEVQCMGCDNFLGEFSRAGGYKINTFGVSLYEVSHTNFMEYMVEERRN